ncbi:MAG TPA: hypothetical protein VLV83_03430 [Acidobacteriota bacterium]|nr:hypothetical protein [Acidobacteriota bacterium]
MRFWTFLMRTGLALAVAALSATPAWACEVCYGAADAPIIDGMNMSILFMLATTYVLIVGMAGGFFFLRRKAVRRAGSQEES